MGSETNSILPIIDFSSTELRPGTPVWEIVRSQVRKAAEGNGCFQAVFRNIPQELQKAMTGALEEIFALPEEIKKLNVSKRPFQGHFGSSLPGSVSENLTIDCADNFDKVQSFTKVLWPEGNINFSKTVHWFSKALAELDQTIRRMIVESFGIEKILDEHMNSTYYFLKLCKYEAPKTSEKRKALRAHTDKNILTILHQNQIDGLEIQNKNGEWLNVKFSPDLFVVMIGESLSAWTNNRLYSPYHRVMMTGNKTRHSAILFSVPKGEYIIKAAEELVDEEHPLQFKPFKYNDYYKLAGVGKKFFLPFKAFFGI